MTRPEIHTCLTEKVEAEWDAHRRAMLQLPSVSVFAKADEIHAARTCYEELVYNANAYPDALLEQLLSLPAPLETVREQWLDEQDRDMDMLHDHLEHALRSICEPEQTADMDLHMEERNERTKELDIHPAGG